MKRFLIIFAVALAAVLGGFFVSTRIRAANMSDQTQYKVAVVSEGAVKKTVSATGTLQPWSTVDIKSKAGGRINALLVDVGSVVKTNQVIARIDPADTLLSVSTAQANIASAVAHTRQSQATYQLQVQQSRIAIKNAQPSQTAAKAAARQAAANLQQAAAQVQEAQVALTQAQANVANNTIKQQDITYSDNSPDLKVGASCFTE